ncbi:MAG: IPT/TIG domain-containing protein [Planctomycetes bacterium]|nr:IPT/TIG domain-containing protein [Planctomycetota bacterium]
MRTITLAALLFLPPVPSDAQAPTIVSVTPNSMHAFEVGPVTVSGTGLGAITNVEIGGIAQPILQQTPTQLVLQKSAGIPGGHTLMVQGPGGQATASFASTPALSSSTAVIGRTLAISLDNGSVGVYVLTLGARTLPALMPLPPFYYGLAVDPSAGFLSLASGFLVTSAPITFPFAIPNDPLLIGGIAIFQCWTQQGFGPAATLSFSNAKSVTIADSWTPRASLLSARAALVVVTVGGKVLAIGGGSGASWNPGTAVEEYDPVLNSWTPRAPMLTARGYSAAGVINGQVFVVAGSGPGNADQALERFDPVANSWASLSPMPTPRWVAGAAVLGGRLHVIGGQAPAPSHALLSTHEVYDPLTDTWSTLAPMPTARQGLGVVAVNGKIYAIGGSTSNNDTSYSRVEAYDPLTNTWLTMSPMPTARAGFGCAVLNGKIYAIGGVRLNQPALSANEEYDPIADVWATRESLPTPRRELGAAALADRILAIGGDSSASGNPVPTVEEFQG